MPDPEIRLAGVDSWLARHKVLLSAAGVLFVVAAAALLLVPVDEEEGAPGDGPEFGVMPRTRLPKLRRADPASLIRGEGAFARGGGDESGYEEPLPEIAGPGAGGGGAAPGAGPGGSGKAPLKKPSSRAAKGFAGGSPSAEGGAGGASSSGASSAASSSGAAGSENRGMLHAFRRRVAALSRRFSALTGGQVGRRSKMSQPGGAQYAGGAGGGSSGFGAAPGPEGGAQGSGAGSIGSIEKGAGTSGGGPEGDGGGGGGAEPMKAAKDQPAVGDTVRQCSSNAKSSRCAIMKCINDLGFWGINMNVAKRFHDTEAEKELALMVPFHEKLQADNAKEAAAVEALRASAAALGFETCPCCDKLLGCQRFAVAGFGAQGLGKALKRQDEDLSAAVAACRVIPYQEGGDGKECRAASVKVKDNDAAVIVEIDALLDVANRKATDCTGLPGAVNGTPGSCRESPAEHYQRWQAFLENARAQLSILRTVHTIPFCEERSRCQPNRLGQLQRMLEQSASADEFLPDLPAVASLIISAREKTKKARNLLAAGPHGKDLELFEGVQMNDSAAKDMYEAGNVWDQTVARECQETWARLAAPAP